MSSEPIERRVSYLGDRLRATRCQQCGKEYFEVRDYCSNCGRKSYGKMDSIDLLFDKGKLELATFINEPTNKFTKLGKFVYGIVSFHDGKTMDADDVVYSIMRHKDPNVGSNAKGLADLATLGLHAAVGVEGDGCRYAPEGYRRIQWIDKHA